MASTTAPSRAHHRPGKAAVLLALAAALLAAGVLLLVAASAQDVTVGVDADATPSPDVDTRPTRCSTPPPDGSQPWPGRPGGAGDAKRTQPLTRSTTNATTTQGCPRGEEHGSSPRVARAGPRPQSEPHHGGSCHAATPREPSSGQVPGANCGQVSRYGRSGISRRHSSWLRLRPAISHRGPASRRARWESPTPRRGRRRRRRSGRPRRTRPPPGARGCPA